eukprot:1160078-Pelagomonas_calceolata.AAC.1
MSTNDPTRTYVNRPLSSWRARDSRLLPGLRAGASVHLQAPRLVPCRPRMAAFWPAFTYCDAHQLAVLISQGDPPARPLCSWLSPSALRSASRTATGNKWGTATSSKWHPGSFAYKLVACINAPSDRKYAPPAKSDRPLGKSLT